MQLFVGTLENYKLDSKGRLSVPTKWRERLGKDFYMVAVTVKGCKCLTLYPEEEFNKMYAMLRHGTANQQYAMRKDFFSKAEECSADSQGRFTVNQRLKALSNMTNESTVVFEGNGETIEIWEEKEFDKMVNSFDASEGIYDMIDKANAFINAEDEA